MMLHWKVSASRISVRVPGSNPGTSTKELVITSYSIHYTKLYEIGVVFGIDFGENFHNSSFFIDDESFS